MEINDVVHIFESKQIHLSPEIIRYINKYKEPNHNHIFYLTCLSNRNNEEIKEEYSKLARENINIVFIFSMTVYMKIILNSKGLIFLHGAISPFKKQFLLLSFVKMFFNKKLKSIVLIAWGGADFNLNSNKYFKRWYHNIIKQFRKTLTLSQNDKEDYEKLFHKEAMYVKYIGANENTNVIQKDGTSIGRSDISNKRIMVSHSGWEQNKHLESFELIKDKLAVDTEIVCPLAYGDQVYINKVIEKGKELFGENFKYFTNLKERKEYEEFLKGIDVYITSADIQTGLFAITSCFANGAKVYCSANLYNSFLDDGFKLFNISELDGLDKNNFFYLSNSDKIHNKHQFYRAFLNVAELKATWNKIYNNEF